MKFDLKRKQLLTSHIETEELLDGSRFHPPLLVESQQVAHCTSASFCAAYTFQVSLYSFVPKLRAMMKGSK
jgi:hypothetical protein